jgi:hypothetical protein
LRSATAAWFELRNPERAVSELVVLGSDHAARKPAVQAFVLFHERVVRRSLAA